MNEKLNKLKQTVKDHRTEIFAISIATAAVGTAVFVVRKERMLSARPYLRMSDRAVKFLTSDSNNSVRFDTKYGPLILKALQPEN